MTVFSKIIDYVREIFLSAIDAVINFFFDTDKHKKRDSDEFEADILFDDNQCDKFIPCDVNIEIDSKDDTFEMVSSQDNKE